MDSDTPTETCELRTFPPEIVEMIIAHLAFDTTTLKACAATCFTWYNIAIPHLYHTLTLRQSRPDELRQYPELLESMHKLGLLRFVKQLRFEKSGEHRDPWVTPDVLSSRSMQHLRALVDLQDLTIADLDLSKFSEGAGPYFGHFAPTLRSVALGYPRGTRRQLLAFLKLFPKLDDISISYYHAGTAAHEALDPRLVPIGGGLRGRLILKGFSDEGLLRDIIVAFGGMRFTSINSQDARWARLILNSCADTLETVRIHPGDTFRLHLFRRHFDLSRNTVLRCLEVYLPSIMPNTWEHTHAIKALLSTVASPVFSEVVIVFSWREIDWASDSLAPMLREMYEAREFKVAFCFEGLEELRVLYTDRLASKAWAAVAAGAYDFLPCPPSIFSRPVTKYDRSSADGIVEDQWFVW